MPKNNQVFAKGSEIFRNDAKILIAYAKATADGKEELKARVIYRDGMERFDDVNVFKSAGEVSWVAYLGVWEC